MDKYEKNLRVEGCIRDIKELMGNMKYRKSWRIYIILKRIKNIVSNKILTCKSHYPDLFQISKIKILM